MKKAGALVGYENYLQDQAFYKQKILLGKMAA